jgi:hypothetical protein
MPTLLPTLRCKVAADLARFLHVKASALQDRDVCMLVCLIPLSTK